MSTTKLVDNKRRNHAAKVLNQTSKIHQSDDLEEKTPTFKNNYQSSLKRQYGIIRDDVLKLRSDLGKGYDLLRDYISKKTIYQDLKGAFNVSKRS